MRTKIFVMAHKKFDEPQSPVYVPMQVGRAVSQNLGYLGDDTGDSISELNKYYGELTGLYWLWKNYPDVDIIGICHYRRYFMDGNGKLLRQEDYENILKQADIMVSNAMQADRPYREYYGEAHNVNDLLAAGEVIKELYPNDYPTFCEVIESSKYYYGNLCVTTKKIFDDYCGWLFPIFTVLWDRVDVSGYDAYHQRLFGFLSEELLRVYIVARGLKVQEGRIGYTSEKAETVEFKLAMGQLVKLGQFSEAREMFYAFMKLRPDICLELSDIRREIPDMELILFILEQEQKQGVKGFYEVSHDLKALIAHLRKIREIVKKGDKNLSKEDKYYMAERNVTELAKEVIRINL